MKLATWNVNSVRAREERLLRWLRANEPDVLCPQELKVLDEAFPSLLVRELGYHAVVYGQKTYNGVATLAKEEPKEVERGLGDDDPNARVISGRVGGLRVVCAYFPNGQVVGSDKWAYKLGWMERLRRYLDGKHARDEPLASSATSTWPRRRRTSPSPTSGRRASSSIPRPAARCTAARIDRDERKGQQASDHAPVVVALAV